MAAPTVFASAVSNPGGTGSTLTGTLSTHAADDYLIIFIENTGNTLWAGNPAGWNRLDQRSVGTSANGIVQTWFWKKAASSSETNPSFTLGATVTRAAICWTVRGADLEGAFALPEWGARGFSTGTSNPVRPPAVTTLAPEMLVLIGYGSRAATNAPDQTNYTQDQEIVISGTLVLNASQRTVTTQTALSNQDASPTSGARWAAGILCIPSPDYVYYRSGSQALTAAGTSATPTLPTGTSSSDTSGRKDLIIATVEAAGTPTIAPNTPADWTQIAGEWATATSGNGTTARKYWTLYDGTLDRQFNRSTSGEIFVYFSVYRNTDQTNPIGAIEAQQNASSTTSAFPSLVRAETKSTVQATCIADATPTFTTPANWIERSDSNGIVCADQAFNAGSTVASASFTLSSASPTACGLVEILSAAGASAITTFERSAAATATADIASAGQFFSIFERSTAIDASATVVASSTVIHVFTRSVVIDATADIASTASFFSILERASALDAAAAITTAAEFFSILEGVAALDATASIASNGIQLPPLSFPNTPILDDFNRANEGPPPSSNWTTGVGLLIGVFLHGHRVVSNALARATGEAESESYWNAAQFGPNAECYLTVSNATGLQELGLSVRVSDIGTGSADGYTVLIFNGGLQVFKTTDGSPALLAAQTSHTIATGNKYGVQAVGGIVRLWCDSGSGWEMLLSADDATLTSAGSIAIFSSSTTTTTFDDFGGGTFGISEIERAGSLDATASVTVTSESFSVLQSAAECAATASVTVAGVREVDRASTVGASGAIETSGELFTIFQSAASLSASAGIESSAISFSVVESVAAVTASATTAVAGTRIVERSLSLVSAGAIEVSAEFFSVFESATSLTATASIESGATFFSVLERQAQTNAAATITVAGQSEQTRTVVVSAAASISVSGVVVPPSATEHERGVSMDASAEIATAAQFFSTLTAASDFSTTATITAAGVSIIPRLVMIEATGAIIVNYQRELQRLVQFAATTTVSAAGYVGSEVERSASLDATATITVSGSVPIPASPRRTFVVNSSQRTAVIRRESRTTKPSGESRQQQA